MIMAEDWGQFDSMVEHDIIGAGTHAFMASYLSPFDLALGGERGWYRSEEKLAGTYPYSGDLSNKKWHLNEEMMTNL